MTRRREVAIKTFFFKRCRMVYASELNGVMKRAKSTCFCPQMNALSAINFAWIALWKAKKLLQMW